MSAAPPDLSLPAGSGEAGFRRFIQAAQSGRLGADVSDANVGVLKNYVRLELLRRTGPAKVLFLRPQNSARPSSRYFDIDAGEGASDDDILRVGKILDEVFDENPFQLSEHFFYALAGGERIPSFDEAWTTDGSRGVWRVLLRRMCTLVDLPYTMAVMFSVATLLIASLFLLWGTTRDIE